MQSIMTGFVRISLLMVLVGVVFLSSCEKEALVDTNLPNTEPLVDDMGKMSCFMREGEWGAVKYKATLFNDVLNFYGVNENNDTIELSVSVDAGNYYQFNNEINQFGAYKNRSVDTIGYLSTLYFSSITNPGESAGYVSFSDLDIKNSIISGIFAFRCQKNGSNNQIPITEGKFFNLKITPSENPNVLTALVNGTDEAVCTYVTAKLNSSTNIMKIDGLFAENKALGLAFNVDTVESGDTLQVDLTNTGYYFDGMNIITCHTGKIIVETFDVVAKKIKVKFDYTYNSTSVEQGNANCTYLLLD
jgi:hypothetical protein